MTLEQTKRTLAAAWVMAMLALGALSYTASTSAWITLVALTIIPPVAMWRFWNDPPQTLSESIREARR